MSRQYSSFRLGFADKGFNGQEVGIDEVSIYKAPETWNADQDGEKEVGTPVVRDLTSDFKLKLCPDGEVPDGYLRRRVGDSYPGEKDFYIQNRTKEDVRPGNPVPFIVNRPHGVLETRLLADGYTPSVEDEVYVNGGLFDGTDPLGGEGTPVGKVMKTKTIDGDTYITFILYGVVDTGETVKDKTAKVNINAPADETEQLTGFTLPDNAVVKDVKVKINTAEVTGTTTTIDVGTNSGNDGDADGFLAGVDVSATGLVKGTLDNAGQTLGDLLTVVSDATNSVKVPEQDIASGGKEITFTAGSADFAELDADIYVTYRDLA